MKNCPIVKIQGWSELDLADKIEIYHSIAKGDSFVISTHNQDSIIKYLHVSKCSLLVRVGKKRKLVSGRVRVQYNGVFDNGDLNYSIIFTPNKSKIVYNCLHESLYSQIQDRVIYHYEFEGMNVST